MQVAMSAGASRARKARVRAAAAATVVIVAAGAWIAPYVSARVSPRWTVTAVVAPMPSERSARQAAACADRTAVSDLVIDSERGSATVRLRGFGWQAEKVARCLRRVDGYRDVHARRG
jgi:hypothetical protein